MKSRYNKIAAVAYDRVADSADEFDLDEVVDEILRELAAEEGATAELLREFAQQLAEKADDKRASRAESGQMDLLTGQAEALDGVWRLGGGKRVRVRNANRSQMLAWLAIREGNAARVMDAYKRDKDNVAALLPYMPDDETSVEQAVEARRNAHPPLT